MFLVVADVEVSQTLTKLGQRITVTLIEFSWNDSMLGNVCEEYLVKDPEICSLKIAKDLGYLLRVAPF